MDFCVLWEVEIWLATVILAYLGCCRRAGSPTIRGAAGVVLWETTLRGQGWAQRPVAEGARLPQGTRRVRSCGRPAFWARGGRSGQSPRGSPPTRGGWGWSGGRAAQMATRGGLRSWYRALELSGRRHHSMFHVKHCRVLSACRYLGRPGLVDCSGQALPAQLTHHVHDSREPRFVHLGNGVIEQ